LPQAVKSFQFSTSEIFAIEKKLQPAVCVRSRSSMRPTEIDILRFVDFSIIIPLS